MDQLVPFGCLIHPASPEAPEKPLSGWTGRDAREEHSWAAGVGSLQHCPARPRCDRRSGDVPSVFCCLLPTAALLKALHGKLLMCLSVPFSNHCPLIGSSRVLLLAA